MCSVIGYIGYQGSQKIVITGLERLEYRGYDSAGFACLTSGDHALACVRAQGQLSELTKKLSLQDDGPIGIGHTRWATHGDATERNAHPHTDCAKNIILVHNGIIENHHALKQELLAQGHTFTSDTDTEVVAHLFEKILGEHGSIDQSVRALVDKIDGAYAFLIMLKQYPDMLIAIRKRSPLCIGVSDNQMFVASDLLAFAGQTDQIVFMPDESYAVITQSSFLIYDFTGEQLTIPAQQVNISWQDIDKKGHPHFMLKEIYEQKHVMYATMDSLRGLGEKVWAQLGVSKEQIARCKRLEILGCGTSFNAGSIAQFFFEQICAIPTSVHLASEFRYRIRFPEEDTLYLFVSQSGETADTLEALRMVKELNMPTIVLSNVATSSMVREAGGFLLTHAGPEVAVASTKAFTTQVSALYWFAHAIALQKKLINQEQMNQACNNIRIVAEVLELSIDNYRFYIQDILAPRYAKYDKFIFLGRHITYPFAQEAALKLKEISYIFSQCYPAGELKHGPIALVDEHVPVVIFSHTDPLMYQKLLANAQEVKARKGHIIAFTFQEQHELAQLAEVNFILPHSNPLLAPLAMTGLMQFFVYQIAKERGCPIDKPRNLAKSVTVE
ncbi:MAG: glutamine--fructose-6-phosphate transaminase (isomerizing) [Candidatus Babeliales bacterium]